MVESNNLFNSELDLQDFGFCEMVVLHELKQFVDERFCWCDPRVLQMLVHFYFVSSQEAEPSKDSDFFLHLAAA